MATMKVPAHMAREFRRFAADFDCASSAWVASGTYTRADVDRARDELRGLLGAAANANDRSALDFWFGLFDRLAREAEQERTAA